MAFGNRDPDVLSTVAGRLARLDRQPHQARTAKSSRHLAGTPLEEITRGLVAALDPDVPAREERAKSGSTRLSPPLAENPELRKRLVEIRKSYEQTDRRAERRRGDRRRLLARRDRRAHAPPSNRSGEFIEDNKNEITALQILYSRPQPQRLTYREVKELANAIERPPRSWTPDTLWRAYEALDRVAGLRLRPPHPHRLSSSSATRSRRKRNSSRSQKSSASGYDAWLLQQENAGRTFSPSSSPGWSGSATRLQLHWESLAKTCPVPALPNAEGSARRTSCSATNSTRLLDELTQELDRVTLQLHPDESSATRSPLWGITASGTVHAPTRRSELRFQVRLFDREHGNPWPRSRPNSATTLPLSRAYVPRHLGPSEQRLGMDGVSAPQWAGSPGLLNQRVCTLRVHDDELYDETFLLYALPGYLDAINAATSSITVKHLFGNDQGDSAPATAAR